MTFYSLTNKKAGFTLVEMIVSIGLFIIVALVAVGALLKIVDANKKSLSMKTSINNLNFALESMSREMRVGSNYTCSSGTCNGATNTWTITFNSSKSTTGCIIKYAYSFNGTSLQKAESTCNNAPSEFAAVISPDVTFTGGTLRLVTGASIQSYARFHFKGYSGVKERNRSYFDLQTTVAQRLSD